ncbi:amidohydrolase family protein [Candidatus Woesearchaeota archaeon]|nr:amidohydrolase family protein [Candidatus Woesearchaeota archaeon]
MAALSRYFIESENIGIYEQILERIDIIDAHAHVGVDRDGHKLSAAELVREMKSNDINQAIIFPQDDPAAGRTFAKPNERILRAYKFSPKKFFPFFRLDPNHDFAAEFAKRVDQGFRGIKLHPRAQNFEIASQKAMKLYEKAEKANLILLIHAGFGLDSIAESFSMVAKTFPKLRILVGHGAFPDLEDAVRLLGSRESVMFEVSTMRIFDLLELLKHLPADRIVFGSDIPYYNQTLSLQALIDSATLAGKQPHHIRKMLGENIQKWLK